MLVWYWSLLSCLVSALEVPKTFENIKVSKNVDLTGSFIKNSVSVEAKNIADLPISDYIISLPESEIANMAAIEADIQGERHMGLPVRALTETSIVDGTEYFYFMVTFPAPVAPGATIVFSYATAIINSLEPMPKKVKQSDPQVMLYKTSKNVFSVYDTVEQVTHIKTLTKNHQELAQGDSAALKIDKKSGNSLGDVTTLDTLSNIRAYASEPLNFQFEAPFPLVFVNKLDRLVWISHWGDAVSFDESYDITNVGPELKSGFSRVDYTKAGIQPINGLFSVNHAAIRALRVSVPSPARDAYYVDLIGNVSTSKITHNSGKSDSFIDVVPRFPIFGGWNYNFTLGWTNPLGRFVHSLGNSRYIASIPLLMGPIDSSYDEVSTTIILPEGAKIIDVEETRHDSMSEGLIYSYLDLQGRTAVKLEFGKLVTDHRKANIIIEYEYTTLAAFRKPVAISVSFFIGIFGLWQLFSMFSSKKIKE